MCISRVTRGQDGRVLTSAINSVDSCAPDLFFLTSPPMSATSTTASRAQEPNATSFQPTTGVSQEYIGDDNSSVASQSDRTSLGGTSQRSLLESAKASFCNVLTHVGELFSRWERWHYQESTTMRQASSRCHSRMSKDKKYPDAYWIVECTIVVSKEASVICGRVKVYRWKKGTPWESSELCSSLEFQAGDAGPKAVRSSLSEGGATEEFDVSIGESASWREQWEEVVQPAKAWRPTCPAKYFLTATTYQRVIRGIFRD